MPNNFKKDSKKIAMILYCLCILFTQFFMVTTLADNYEEYKITITKRNDQQDFIGGIQSDPFSIDIVDDIYGIVHVKEVVPAVVQSYGMVSGDHPPGNFSDEIPNWNITNRDKPPDWNGSPPEGNFDHGERNMFDYIVEGVPLDSLTSFTSYEVPIEVVAGRQLEKNDSSVVFIGEGAQDYFNVSIGEIINIEKFNFTVIGVFSDVNYSRYVFMNLTDARTLINIPDNEVNTLYVYVDDLDFLDVVSNEIQSRFSYLMTRYMGNTDQFRPPDTYYQFTGENRNDVSAPGLELVIFLCAISFFVLYRKFSKGGR